MGGKTAIDFVVADIDRHERNIERLHTRIDKLVEGQARITNAIATLKSQARTWGGIGGLFATACLMLAAAWLKSKG